MCHLQKIRKLGSRLGDTNLGPIVHFIVPGQWKRRLYLQNQFQQRGLGMPTAPKQWRKLQGRFARSKCKVLVCFQNTALFIGRFVSKAPAALHHWH